MSPEENPAPVTGAGRKKRLSREVVLSAALALVDAERIDAFTLRRLGQELGRVLPPLLTLRPRKLILSLLISGLAARLSRPEPSTQP